MIERKTKSQEIAKAEVLGVFNEISRGLEARRPTYIEGAVEKVAAILTLATIINMNSKPIYIVESGGGVTSLGIHVTKKGDDK